MFRKVLLAVAMFIATMGFAFAQVDVNKADQAALDSVKGIGPKISKSIIDERKRGGDFKDWDDFQKRVKGIGDKNGARLSQAGLTVNGQSKPNAPAASRDAKGAKGGSKKDAGSESKDAKAGSRDSRKEARAEAKDSKMDNRPEARDGKKEDARK